MRRVRYESRGGPLFVEEAPPPAPGPGELLVRAEAIGVTLPVVRKVGEAAEPRWAVRSPGRSWPSARASAASAPATG
ncbi:hypothetical protein GCM10010309_08040 [Streptomyces violaceochromogenes]|nr:hypothetical protein GCM10010309_08040 [Streptomyces violaceochromogenes]